MRHSTAHHTISHNSIQNQITSHHITTCHTTSQLNMSWHVTSLATNSHIMQLSLLNHTIQQPLLSHFTKPSLPIHITQQTLSLFASTFKSAAAISANAKKLRQKCIYSREATIFIIVVSFFCDPPGNPPAAPPNPKVGCRSCNVHLG